MKILILGSNGLVGSSLKRVLPVIFPDAKVIASTRKDANLFSIDETRNLIEEIKPNIIVNAAAKVGGIVANDTMRSEFILDNLKINMNILESLIKRPEIYFINLGSSCIYPLKAEIPISEDSLMTGKLEPTNSPYAMAKLTSIEIGDALTKQFGNKIINLMPTNLYGPNDNFSHFNSHVIPGIISRMQNSKINKDKSFTVWGTGKPLREFLYVDDLSKAIAFIIKNKPSHSILNVGSGKEISISNLVHLIKDVVKFDGEILFDSSMPDGNPRKLIDSSKLHSLGWEPQTDLKEGLIKTYTWYLKNI